MYNTAIFIDGGYIKNVLKQYGQPRISYKMLSDCLVPDKFRLRSYYYDCAPYTSSTPTPQEKSLQANFDRFKRRLDSEPRFQVKLGRLQKFTDNGKWIFTQKMVDVLLSVDLVKLSMDKQIIRAILIAGDSDFVPAINVARDSGVIVTLYYYKKPKPHDELLDACDERYLIDQQLIDQCIVS